MSTLLESVETLLKQQQSTWVVTGVAGFIGSHLLETLLKNRQNVIGIDNFSTGKKENLDNVKAQVSSDAWEKFSFYERDLSDFQSCQEVIQNVDYILHQGALGSIPRSLDNPMATHQSNVNGFLNILEVSKKTHVKKIVYASSSSVYGDDASLPKQEEKIGEQLSPYAVSKRINELYAGVYAKSFGLNLIGLRYFNVFGPRQNPQGAYAAVIPRWIQTLIAGDQATIFGDGETSRDFTHVDNVVNMNLLAALTPHHGHEVINCACHKTTSLNTLYELIKTFVKEEGLLRGSPEVLYQDFRSGDIRHSDADISKAQELFKYSPVKSVEEGLRETVKWFCSNNVK